MPNTNPTQEQKDRWHADPANWKAWLIYYNKEDPRLFPPKRTYLGWTVNFANPRSIVAMVVLVGALVGVIGLATGRGW